MKGLKITSSNIKKLVGKITLLKFAFYSVLIGSILSIGLLIQQTLEKVNELNSLYEQEKLKNINLEDENNLLGNEVDSLNNLIGLIGSKKQENINETDKANNLLVSQLQKTVNELKEELSEKDNLIAKLKVDNDNNKDNQIDNLQSRVRSLNQQLSQLRRELEMKSRSNGFDPLIFEIDRNLEKIADEMVNYAKQYQKTPLPENDKVLAERTIYTLVNSAIKIYEFDRRYPIEVFQQNKGSRYSKRSAARREFAEILKKYR